MACLGISFLRFDRSDNGFGIHGQVADAYAEGGVDRVRDRGGGGSLRGLTGAERRLVARDEVYVDAGRRGEPQDRIALPVVAGDSAPVEAHSLERGPARRLHRTAGELVAGAVWVDHQPEVSGDGEPAYPDLALGLDLRHDRAPRALVLVAREADSAPDCLGEPLSPAGLEGGQLITARARGSVRCASRKSTGSSPVSAASSSTKDSIANTLKNAPRARMADVRSGATVKRWPVTRRGPTS